MERQGQGRNSTEKAARSSAANEPAIGTESSPKKSSNTSKQPEGPIRFGGGGKSTRLDAAEWQVSRRLPPRFRSAKNDVYITKKTKIAAQFERCKTLLDTKCDSVVIHALGHAIGRALSLGLMLEEAMAHSVKLDMLTSSVQVTDDIVSLLDADQEESRQRTVSAVHLLASRIL